MLFRKYILPAEVATQVMQPVDRSTTEELSEQFDLAERNLRTIGRTAGHNIGRVATANILRMMAEDLENE